MDKIAGILDANDFAFGVEAGSGNQAVQMRMELHVLAPGVKDGHETADLGAESLGRGQFFGQGGGNGRKEQIVELFGKGAEEAGAQFLRQGESHHEVRGVDLLLQAALHPDLGGGLAATRAGFVVAAMEGKMIGSAICAGKAGASHGRGSAMGDGPDGAALGAGKHRRSL